jgi:hypothetical protein
MEFANNVVNGIEQVKQFFVKLDAPYDTVHNVTGVWQIGNAFIMQGSADLRKKGAPPETAVHVSPLFNVIWLDDLGKISRYVVTMSPQAEHAAAKSGPRKQ